MKEITLRHFFDGHATAAELDADVQGTLVRDGPECGPPVYHYRVLPMRGEFELRPDHLVRLLDATHAGQFRVENLQTVCSWLEGAFERFLRDGDTPDGERASNAILWLGNPEINYPLTPAVLGKVRHYLLTGEKTLSYEDTKAGNR